MLEVLDGEASFLNNLKKAKIPPIIMLKAVNEYATIAHLEERIVQ